MSGKEMEGDNARRRALARQAREQGRRASETGVTLGASKQPEYVKGKRRDGPPVAGAAHKPRAGTGGPPPPAPTAPQGPRHPLTGPAAPGPVRYQELLDEVSRRTGLGFDRAKLAAEATVTVLAQTLREPARQRLLDAVPGELHDGEVGEVLYPPEDLARFLAEVARLAHGTAEQARYQAQAVLSAIGEQDAELIVSLDLPPDLQNLVEPLAVGGGLVNPAGHPAPLTDAELRAALSRLPQWSGTRRAISRALTLPPDRLDSVLGHLEELRADWARGPKISRSAPDTAILLARTSGVDAVTALDIELAHRLDDTIAEAIARLP